ncbi:Ejaculatory bulb-specific protein 3 [Papilio machaon]|uniref:Ejaculatory bulb-specific protein 3 n=1 Tax=Papilio machaon TaxID=76193 RepID=A0A194QXJ1_PAPMA|nr:Ejaculatory bulb-specific protein 3 [Papilio machaon]
MKLVILLFLVSISLSVNARASGKYTDRYDGINVGDVVSNRRLLLPYLKCLLEQGKCSPEGRELKSHIREALENYCAKCTDTQRRGTRIVIAHLINNEPAYWKQLTDKYDRQHKYVTKYEAELRTIKS